MTGNKIADKITIVWKTSSQNSLEKTKNENDKEIPKEIYIYRRKAELYLWNENKVIVGKCYTKK